MLLCRICLLSSAAMLLRGVPFLGCATVLLRNVRFLGRAALLHGVPFLTNVLLRLPENGWDTQKATKNRRNHCSLHRAVS